MHPRTRDIPNEVSLRDALPLSRAARRAPGCRARPRRRPAVAARSPAGRAARRPALGGAVRCRVALAARAGEPDRTHRRRSACRRCRAGALGAAVRLRADRHDAETPAVFEPFFGVGHRGRGRGRPARRWPMRSASSWCASRGEVHELLITHNFVIGWFVREVLQAPDWRWMTLNQAHCGLTVLAQKHGRPWTLALAQRPRAPAGRAAHGPARDLPGLAPGARERLRVPARRVRVVVVALDLRRTPTTCTGPPPPRASGACRARARAASHPRARSSRAVEQQAAPAASARLRRAGRGASPRSGCRAGRRRCDGCRRIRRPRRRRPRPPRRRPRAASNERRVGEGRSCRRRSDVREADLARREVLGEQRVRIGRVDGGFAQGHHASSVSAGASGPLRPSCPHASRGRCRTVRRNADARPFRHPRAPSTDALPARAPVSAIRARLVRARMAETAAVVHTPAARREVRWPMLTLCPPPTCPASWCWVRCACAPLTARSLTRPAPRRAP